MASLPTMALISALISASFIAFSSSISHADEVDLRRLIHGPNRCDHVISLLMRHGVNDNTSRTGMTTLHPLGPIQLTAADMGDLQLVSITRNAETDVGCGPTFDVVIKNCSTREVCGSRLTLVGLLGRIRPTSPNVTIKLDSLPAGQAMQATVTMPIESLSMGSLNGQAVGFNRVLVVVDSFDQFMESNEANNLRTFDLASIPVSTPAMEVSAVEGVAQPLETSAIQPERATQQSTNATPAPPAATGKSDLQSAIDQFSSGSES